MNKYNAYYVPSTALGTEDTAVSKLGALFSEYSMFCPDEAKQQINDTRMYQLIILAEKNKKYSKGIKNDSRRIF